MKLANKVALVVGTSPNIGGGIAEELAAAGADIVAVDTNPEYATACANYVCTLGRNALPITCDATVENQVVSAAEKAAKEFGRIDILVNNAAFFNRKGVLETSYEEWEAQLRLILGGTFLFTKYVGKEMIDRKTPGSIINIVSTAGHQGEPGNIAYGTAKSGLLNFTRQVAMEFAAYHIRVNSLTPTATEMDEYVERAKRWGMDVSLPDYAETLLQQFRDGIPLRSLPRPSDYGKAAVFLVSDDARHITGTDLRVDAGAVSRYWAWQPEEAYDS